MIYLPTDVQKYLSKNLNSRYQIELVNQKFYDNIIVIPALAELENVKSLLLCLSRNDKKYFSNTLILLVINNTISASSEIKENNIQTIKYLRNILKSNYSVDFSHSGLNIALIDAASPGKEMDNKNGGVGLARKIGMDYALKYFNYKSTVKKLLICLDADCTVAPNYITEVVDYFNRYKINAAVISYEHNIDRDDDNTAAIVCYELYLRYYLLGLKFAQSPFAFHTIGSTMVCDYESYIKIGGMNKLKAAEDFYFLEKLSKITDVHTIKSTFVYPSSRPSFRVPFGTGQRVNRFLAQIQNEYLLYDPKSFIVLKNWLNIYNEFYDKDFNKLMNLAGAIDKNLLEFIRQQKFERFWIKLFSQKINNEQILKQKKYWFDSFRTLKLIHHLRDSSFPLINMFEAIDLLMEMSDVEIKIDRKESLLPDLDIQKEYLLLLRKIQNN